MNIYILTSDKNVHVVEGLQYCVNKYWKPNPNVIILGYKEPKFELDSNFTFYDPVSDNYENGFRKHPQPL